jgi:CDGSH-type Zn-finger protein
MSDPGTKITVIQNGPLQLETDKVEVTMADGSVVTNEGTIYLCRCGQSKNKPYCDGSHTTSGFKD